MARKIYLVITVGIFSGIMMSFMYVNPFSSEILLSEVVLQLSGARGPFSLNPSLTELIRFMLCMIPNYIIMLLLGYDLYCHFCTASIYVFSRCVKRQEWYFKIIRSLAGKVFLFEVFFLLSVILTTEVRCQIVFTQDGWGILLFHVIIYFLWNFLWILFINLLAIKCGSSDAYLTAMTIQLVCITILSGANVLKKMMVSEDTIRTFIYANPISHIVIGWHYHEWLADGLAGGRYRLEPISSVAILGGMCIFLTAAGARLIGKHDLILGNAETGTM